MSALPWSGASSIDEDALVAAADLVGRSGASKLEFGWLHDDVPVAEAGWWAHAQYQGARIMVENQPGPVEAAEALARRILEGGRCAHCGGLVALSDRGAVAFENVTMADGSTWTVAEARAAGQCRWTRMGRRWKRGCEVEREPSRQQRRAQARAERKGRR